MNNRALEIFRKHRPAAAGLVVLALLLAGAASVGWWSPYPPNEWQSGAEQLGPGWSHWLGTDDHGRDIATRLLYGARYSLLIGVVAVAVSIVIGVPLGAVAGYFGGTVDFLISRLIDIMLSFPSILLAICIAATLGPGLKTIIIAVGIVGIPQFARQVRASVLTVKEMEFVQAGRALGAGHLRLLGRHILPNTLGPLIVLTTLSIGTAILSAAGLSFLGLGAEPGTAEWGAMLRDGYNYWRRSANLAVYSGLAISIVVLAFNLIGDGLRDALDPKSLLAGVKKTAK